MRIPLRIKLSYNAILGLGIFIIGASIRLLPELLSDPYPVGFDLLAGYAPSLGTFPEVYS